MPSRGPRREFPVLSPRSSGGQVFLLGRAFFCPAGQFKKVSRCECPIFFVVILGARKRRCQCIAFVKKGFGACETFVSL